MLLPIQITSKGFSFSTYRWVCKNHLKTNDFVPIPPLVEDDFLRSMSVVPYLEDLHNSSPDEETPEPLSYNEESFSAGMKMTIT